MNFLSLANRNIKEIYRDPVSMILGLFLPIALLLLFSSLNRNNQLEAFSPQALTPGIIIFSFAFLLMFSAILLAKDRKSAFLIRLFATPLKPADFILAYILPFLPLALFQIALCFLTGVLLGASFSNIFLAIIILLLVALSCISTGVIMGSLLTENQVSGVGALLITAISLFSGAWMDLKMVGGVFELIGYAMPFAHGVDVSKNILAGNALSGVSNNIFWIISYAAVLFVLAIFAFRRAMKKI